MLNSEDTYYRCGQQAARARRLGDEACAQFHTTWFREAKRLEREQDQPYAEAAFRDGYTSRRNVPKVTPWVRY